MSQKSQTPADATPMIDLVAALRPFVPALSIGTAWLENLTDLCSESASFVADRLRDDVKTQHAILHCKSMVELQQVQSEFLQRMLDQYAAETDKLVAISTAMVANVQGRIKSDA
jgi:hypothetical protein